MVTARCQAGREELQSQQDSRHPATGQTSLGLAASERIEQIRRFLQQPSDEYAPFPEMLKHLAQLAA